MISEPQYIEEKQLTELDVEAKARLLMNVQQNMQTAFMHMVYASCPHLGNYGKLRKHNDC